MEKRIGVVGIIVENRLENAPRVNAILSEHARMILGRMGIPDQERNVGLITLVIEGTTDEIGALTGKLGSVPGVAVKTALAPAKGERKA
ncbi:TM1266 family iron-only hydrogenase system putative regulator [Desulfothermobacter acidiphilus]|uniref:TM1266 family iron-only hydrogenase system putative regulator n=1 Tax=Desulfothermobacter acidiphilus TaxID=1938353 RepID=UPI003F8B3F8C